MSRQLSRDKKMVESPEIESGEQLPLQGNPVTTPLSIYGGRRLSVLQCSEYTYVC